MMTKFEEKKINSYFTRRRFLRSLDLTVVPESEETEIMNISVLSRQDETLSRRKKLKALT